MEKKDITIGVVGAGGDGVVAAGDILARSAAHEGLHCMMVTSFGPQVRGGESSCRTRISADKVYSQGNGLNALVCFDWDDYKRFSDELDVEEDVVILADAKDETPDDKLPITGGKKRTLLKVPFAELADNIGNPKVKNVVMLGVLAELFGLPKSGLKLAVQKRFAGKKPQVIEANLKALGLGEDFARSNFKDFRSPFRYTSGKPRLVLTGNEAVSFGALAAGCRFYSSYPITPASEIMEWLSAELPKFGGAVVQAEDEIAAICMVTGAAYGGVRAMTATSGPGLSLKLESIGLGAMAELPYVVIDVQRGGPSTGLPTKSEQADLAQAIYGMHGDAPHAVLAAADVEDCFRITTEAFNIADTYQMPVVLLSDQFLGHRMETVQGLSLESIKIMRPTTPQISSKEGFKRFADTSDGISPMTWPGIAHGEYLSSGIEHDEWGAPTAEHTIHEKMCAKRHKKMEKLKKEYRFIRMYGVHNPEVGVITWGSNKGVVREAVEYLANKGASVGAIVPQLIFPLQEEIFKRFLKSVKSLVVVENSYGGLFLRYLRSWVDIPEEVVHIKSAGGRFFTVREVICGIERALAVSR